MPKAYLITFQVQSKTSGYLCKRLWAWNMSWDVTLNGKKQTKHYDELRRRIFLQNCPFPNSITFIKNMFDMSSP